MDIANLVDRYCAVWNEPSAAAREQALAPIWADGGTYSDPNVEAVGAHALVAHIGRMQAARPSFRIVRTSGIDRHHDVARFAWQGVLEDGGVMVEGLDIVVLDGSGRKIARIVGFFGPLDMVGSGV